MRPPGPASGVSLRNVQPRDLEVFFANMQDPGAIAMAAFTPEDPADRAEFDTHWNRILQKETVTMRSVVVHGEIAGNIGSFASDIGREVTYWIGRPFWGSGIATETLRQFLEIDNRRPIYARVVTDNLRSIRVLESNGFSILSTEEAFAHGRGEVVSEHVMTLSS